MLAIALLNHYFEIFMKSMNELLCIVLATNSFLCKKKKETGKIPKSPFYITKLDNK